MQETEKQIEEILLEFCGLRLENDRLLHTKKIMNLINAAVQQAVAQAKREVASEILNSIRDYSAFSLDSLSMTLKVDDYRALKSKYLPEPKSEEK